MVSAYGGRHQSIRRKALSAAIGQPCARCGRLMRAGQQLDLDHSDDRTGYIGFSHAVCNRRAGGALGAARKAAARKRARTEWRHHMFTECALGIDVSEDRQHTSIAAAGTGPDDTVLLELAAYLPGVAGVVAAVLEMRAEVTVRAVVIDPHSQAATLIAPLTAAGVLVTQPSTSDIVVATGGFRDLLAAKRLRHGGQPELTEAVRHGRTRPLGGATTWVTRGTAVDTSPLTAGTLACWALLNVQPPFFAATYR